MSGSLGSWFQPNWSDPRVIGVVALMAILALAGRWALVLLLALLVALGQGMKYLLGHSALSPGFTNGAVMGVYLFGGILLLFLAIAHFVNRE